MIKQFRIAAVAVLTSFTLLATPLLASAQEFPDPQRTISVSGQGIVTVEPDMATFSVGMEARNAELKPAQDEVTDEANAITAALLEAGVEERDIVTSSYQVTPENKYDRNGNFLKIDNYVVRMTISITVRDISLVGELLDKTVSLGADYVSSISFGVSDPSPHIQEARKLAIADAKLKAEDYAFGSDSTLTGLFSLYESSSPSPTAKDTYREYEESAVPMAAADGMVSNPVDVSAGTTKIVVRVETTWTIEPNNLIEPEATPAN
ncbi:MAG: SIMPL domain-containing protein [Thermomicrobiales bacterium]|nr:SIMPL domain-containing protein [Thermomicrobiales bacterium]MCO5224612.1 SIMPL domain-containing protein [Thermomicrobiales bacterium]